MLFTAYKIICGLRKKPNEVVGALFGIILFFATGLYAEASSVVNVWTSGYDDCVSATDCHSGLSADWEDVPFALDTPAAFTSTQVFTKGIWFILKVQNFGVSSLSGVFQASGEFANNYRDVSMFPDGYYFLWNSNDSSYLYFSMLSGEIVEADGVGGFIPFSPLESYIYYIDPSNRELVSSSSPVFFDVEFFISENDWESDLFLRLRYVREQNLQSAVANQDLLWTNIDFDDYITDRYNFLSTTTSNLGADGVYLLKAEVRRDPSWWETALSWFNPFGDLDSNILVSTSTTFIYGEPTAFDNFVASTTQSISDYMASSTISFEQAKNSCWSFSGFDFSECLNFIFGWQQAPMSDAFNNIKNGFFTYAPFGYVTRAYTIFSSSATSSLPILSYTFSTSTIANPLSGQEFSFNPWQYFYIDGAPVKDDLVSSNGKNVWDIFEPIIKLIVYLTLFFMIFKDLLALNNQNNDKNL